jgi:hypothetical protein
MWVQNSKLSYIDDPQFHLSWVWFYSYTFIHYFSFRKMRYEIVHRSLASRVVAESDSFNLAQNLRCGNL